MNELETMILVICAKLSLAMINGLSMALDTIRNAQPSSLVSEDIRSDTFCDRSSIAHVRNYLSSKLDGIFSRSDLRVLRSQAIAVWESDVL
jgi:hypothetical protein